MPTVTDYPTSFFADNVRMSFKARKEMPWGKNVPELLFRHFVVPIRVNNEALDNARSVFYNELKDRIKGMVDDGRYHRGEPLVPREGDIPTF